MAKPNSMTTLIRRLLVKWIQPMPDMDEAWCLDCSLNGGETLVVPANAVKIHAMRHVDADTGHHRISIISVSSPGNAFINP